MVKSSMKLVSRAQIEEIQQELLTTATNIYTPEHFQTFINLFELKTLQFSDEAKLDLLFQVCTICPGFPGNKPPYLEKNNSVLFAKRLLKYKKQNKLKREIVLLSLGISDGARIYQRVLFARILGVKIHLIGIDYSQDYLNQSKKLFPNQEFILLDIYDLSKKKLIYNRLREKIDFIDLSFLLHEIYSFTPDKQANAKIDDKKGRARVRELLVTCKNLLRKGGEIIIKDGYISPNPHANLRVIFSDLYRNAYDLLKEQYKPVKLPNFEANSNELRITKQELILALDKITFFLRLRRRTVTRERIAREMQEVLFFLTEADFKKLLKKVGFKTYYTGKFDQEVFKAHQTKNITIVKGKKDLPPSYLIIMATKT